MGNDSLLSMFVTNEHPIIAKILLRYQIHFIHTIFQFYVSWGAFPMVS